MRRLLVLFLGAALLAGFAITPASADSTQTTKTKKGPKKKGQTKTSGTNNH
jgi:hypothetical protein